MPAAKVAAALVDRVRRMADQSERIAQKHDALRAKIESVEVEPDGALVRRTPLGTMIKL